MRCRRSSSWAAPSITLTVSPALILGWGPFPRLGVRRRGRGDGDLLRARHARAARLPRVRARARPSVARSACDFARRLFWDILRVGAPGSLNTIQTNLTVVILTGLVGPFGSLALAGYGVGARLEYLQIPLVFGLGSALVTMVGTNIGAGQHARARRIMWSAPRSLTVLTGTIGLAAALAPDVWLGLFSQDPEVLAAGRDLSPHRRARLRLLRARPRRSTSPRRGWGVSAGRSSRASRGCPSPRSAAGSSCTGSAAGCPALFAIITLALVVFGTTVALALWRRS